MASKKSAGSLAWKIIIGILVALLVLILLAEFGLRWFIGHQMTSQFNEAAEQEGIQVKEDPSVSFGGSPLLLGLLKGSISQMDMTTPSTLQIDGTDIKGQPASEIHVEDMSTDQENPVAGKLRASTTVPDDYLLASFQKGISEQAGSEKVGNMVVTEINANEQDHVLDVKFAGGLANLSLEPTAHDGKLDIRATEASIFGLELPDQATEAISSALQNGMSDQFVGSDMNVDSVEVLDGELKLTITGTDVPMNDMDKFAGGGNSAGQGGATGNGAPQQDAQKEAA
ncbi:LmeA family phospholipid-binding protein [Corynebacterium tuberculostearicum]|uniref:DUF2993 domain-containing protein n=2 Tax=Corynebacterium tuberculostearicum TaxID=38304 RepID=A0A8I1L990_9CORY|nr:LmeA family phospholipid-binding protein [Corynebacterium tuberculostearicum]EET78041.1 hypothetical protein CORTU0001_0965 [Corynebacterium tuberculostearicum SK141]MBK3428393.1 DUF2993 domain-containing protein [Corynebacterium tuberculostearicum]